MKITTNQEIQAVAINQINAEMIDAVYYDIERWLAQAIAVTCLRASLEELTSLFSRLRGSYRIELANILCNETFRCRKNFLKKRQIESSFLFCRYDGTIRRIILPKSSKPNMSTGVTNGKRHHPKRSKLLLAVQVMSIPGREYDELLNYVKMYR